MRPSKYSPEFRERAIRIARESERPTTAEREEFAALRRENRDLRRSNEILKAASVFFARELDQPRLK
jgi:transposase